MRKTLLACAMLAIAAALGVGCGSGGGGGANSSGSASATTVAPAGGGATGGGATGEQAAQLPAGTPIEASRAVVYTADLSMKVDDVVAVSDDIVRAAEAAGGFLSSQQIDPATGEGVGTATVEVRVPSAQFRPVLTAIAALGSVLDQTVNAADVTDQVVDLQARLATAKASADRVRALMAQAHDLGEVASLEHEVTVRETTVEQLEGTLQVVQDQVALATISARIGEVAPPPPSSPHDPKPNKDIPGFVRGLEQGWVTFRDVSGVVLTGVGAALPFLLILVPGWLAFRLYRRSRAALVR